MTDTSVTHFLPRASYSWNGNTTVSPLDSLDENKEALCVPCVLEREMWLKSKSFISAVCVQCVLVCMWVCETETIRWKAFKGQPTRPWALSHLTDHLIHGSLRHMQECPNICPIHQTMAGLKILKNVFGGWRKHRRGGGGVETPGPDTECFSFFNLIDSTLKLQLSTAPGTQTLRAHCDFMCSFYNVTMHTLPVTWRWVLFEYIVARSTEAK